MITDFLNEFVLLGNSDGAAGTRNVGDVIDLRAVNGGDLGTYPPIYWYIRINAAPTGATTVEFKLVSDAQNPPATDGSATQLISTGAIAIAALPAKRIICIPLPAGIANERYLGLQVANVGASSLATMTFTSGLTLTPRNWIAYPDGAN